MCNRPVEEATHGHASKEANQGSVAITLGSRCVATCIVLFLDMIAITFTQTIYFILRQSLYLDNVLGCIGQGAVEPMVLRMVCGGHLQTTGGCLWKSRMWWAFGVADVALGPAFTPCVVAVKWFYSTTTMAVFSSHEKTR